MEDFTLNPIKPTEFRAGYVIYKVLLLNHFICLYFTDCKVVGNSEDFYSLQCCNSSTEGSFHYFLVFTSAYWDFACFIPLTAFGLKSGRSDSWRCGSCFTSNFWQLADDEQNFDWKEAPKVLLFCRWRQFLLSSWVFWLFCFLATLNVLTLHTACSLAFQELHEFLFAAFSLSAQ